MATSTSTPTTGPEAAAGAAGRGEVPIGGSPAGGGALGSPGAGEAAPREAAPGGAGASAVAGGAAARPLLLVAACALVDGDGRVLVQRRPEGRPMAGFWELPGGKLRAGEGPEAGLVRELAEELGIAVEPACLAPLTFASHAYPAFHLLMPLWVCRRWRGEPRPREGQRLRWVRPRELRTLAMPPADLPLIPFLEELLGG